MKQRFRDHLCGNQVYHLDWRTYVLVLFTLPLSGLQARAQGVADQAGNYVNELTGDFRYSVPLMSVPGPNGESFPISVNYGSGIQVEQEASWVGLGWSLELGQITRKVNGVPDDYKRIPTEHLKFSGFGAPTEETTTYCGPLYFQSMINNATDDGAGGYESMDLYQSQNDLPFAGGSFHFPDHDEFYVSGPGVGGKMLLHRFEYASLSAELRDEDPSDDYAWNYLPRQGVSNPANTGALADYHAFENWEQAGKEHFRPQFYMHGQDHAAVKAPWYNAIGNAVMGQFPWQNQKTPAVLASSSFGNDLIQQSGQTTNHVKGKYHIEYFTNEEIHAGGITGFLETQSGGFNRTALGTDANLKHQIGAIRVHTPSGMTYHYSLPVYTQTDSVKIFPLKDDYNVNTSTFVNEAEMFVKAFPYATAWKLTAITGVNFEDDGDGIPDAGDKGYWVNIHYQLWANDFGVLAPHYGYHLDLSTNAANREQKNWYRRLPDNYKKQGNSFASQVQLYYPEYVETATHTAFFFKNLRADAHGRRIGNQAHPQLRLEKVVLLKNDILDSNQLAYSQLTGTQPLTAPNSRYNLTGTVPLILNRNQYDNRETLLMQHALRVASFSYDYSLAKGIYNHYDNFASSPLHLMSGTTGNRFHWFSDYGSAVTKTGGKLTLNEVTLSDYQGFRGTPSYQFSYGTNNPFYDHLKTTRFGYYNADYIGVGYSGSSAGSTPLRAGSFSGSGHDAWSLTQVTTPSGGEVNVTYEPDRVHRTQYTWNGSGTAKAASDYYLISAVSQTGNNSLQLTLEDGSITPMIASGSQTDKVDIHIPCECTLLGSGLIRERTITLYAHPQASIAHSGSNLIVTDIPTPFHPDCQDSTYVFTGGVFGTPVTGEAYVKVTFDELTAGGVRVHSLELKEPYANQSYTRSYTYEDGVAPTLPTSFMTTNDVAYPLMTSTYGGDRHAPPVAVGYGKVTSRSLGIGGKTTGKTVRTFSNHEPPVEMSYFYRYYGANQTELYEIIYGTQIENSYGQLQLEEHFDAADNRVGYTKYNYSFVKGGEIQEAYYSHRYNFVPTPSGAQLNHLRSVYAKSWVTPGLVSMETLKDGIVQRIDFSDFHRPTGAVGRTEYTGENNVHVVKTTTFSGDHYENGKYVIGRPQREEVYHDQEPLSITEYQYTATLPTLCRDNGQWSRCSVSLTNRNRLLRSRVYDGIQNFDTNFAATASANLAPGGEPTLYNTIERPLEEYDARNEMFTARKYTQNEQYTLCEIGHANYFSATFTSFEGFLEPDVYDQGDAIGAASIFDGGLSVANGARSDNGQIRTGQYSLLVPASTVAGAGTAYEVQQIDPAPQVGNPFANPQGGLIPGRTYVVTVWAHVANPTGAGLEVSLTDPSQALVFPTATVDETSSTQVLDGWRRLRYEFTVPETYQSGTNGSLRIAFVNPGGTPAYFDDFMLRPVDAQVSGYVYQPDRDLVEAEINSQNFKTQYTYDKANRVTTVWQETNTGLKRVSRKRYGFIR